MPDGLRIAGEHATARVPLARPEQTAGDVRDAMAGVGYDYADDVAVLEGKRLVGIVPLEVLMAAAQDARLAELMDDDPPVVTPAVDQESVAWAMVRKNESRSAHFPRLRSGEIRKRAGSRDRTVAHMGVPAIETHDLHMHYGEGRTEVRALDGVDLVVEAGEMVSIMGPSGSGKSTLLHLVGALESPTSGTIAVAGRPYEGLDDKELTELRRDHIGFVFQFFNLLPSLTAEENVTLPAVIAKRHDPALRERARMLLERVGLSDRIDHLPAELSGGQQQRVSIARALLLSPELVLADEPTGNLDTKSGREVLRVLCELNDEEGHTVVMVTHDPAAAATADRVIFLRDGKLAGEVEGGSTRRAAEYLASLQIDAEPEPAAA